MHTYFVLRVYFDKMDKEGSEHHMHDFYTRKISTLIK
jgi:hypothetical protein